MLKEHIFTNSFINLYTNNNCLYLKTSLEETFKLYKYAYLYNYILDKDNKAHICLIDYKSNVIYITFNNNNLNNVSSFKLNISLKNLKNLSVYTINNLLHVFFTKKLNKNEFIINHLIYDFYNQVWNLFEVGSTNKYSNQIYCVNILNNCLLCSYYTYVNKSIIKKIFSFDEIKKCWNDYHSQKTSQLLMNYCDSITYK